MRLHLVGGFLGSGKTTAIVNLSKLLMQQGKRVGVVTNDQGKYLVDTAFLRAEAIPSVEVTHGCFCCNYDSLEEKLTQLQESAYPDVIFAESVGSCSDLVATVIKPLLELSSSKTPPASFSVFTDSRLLLASLEGEELPFSENVTYIFHQQIEEAGILIMNKIDLLSADEITELNNLAVKAFPHKTLLCQNSQASEDVYRWYNRIEACQDTDSLEAITMDYSRYGSGEAELAWFDQEISVESESKNIIPRVAELIRTIQNKLQQNRTAIGHIKLLITTPEKTIKVSILSPDDKSWQSTLSPLISSKAHILLNARVQTDPEILNTLISEAVQTAFAGSQVKVEAKEPDYFKPGFPKPTHRFGSDQVLYER